MSSIGGEHNYFSHFTDTDTEGIKDLENPRGYRFIYCQVSFGASKPTEDPQQVLVLTTFPIHYHS